MTKRALIVIDLQNDYFPDGKWALDNILEASGNAADILADARAAGDEIVHVRHEFPTGDAPFFAPGTKGAEINDAVAPRDGEPIVLKRGINAFLDTDLEATLDAWGVTDVTIVGAMSHMCIDAAARAASDFGYVVTVVEDACGASALKFGDKTISAADAHAAYMAALEFAYAKVTTTASYLSDRAKAA